MPQLIPSAFSSFSQPVLSWHRLNMLLPSFIFVTAWCLVLPCLGNFTEDDTHELHRRGIRVVGSSGPGGVDGIRDLFLIDEYSHRDNHIDTLDTWVQEAATLHTGLDHAFRHATNGNLNSYIAHFMMFFGVQWDFDPKKWKWKDDDLVNERIVEAIEDHINRVTQFLTGGGLVSDDESSEKPRLFCSGAPFEKQEPGRAARDINGKDMVMARDDTTGAPTEYLTVDRAFSQQRNGGNNVFWVLAFNGYDFSETDSMCPPPDSKGRQRVGRTAKPISSGLFDYWNGEEMVEYNMGKTNRHIILCPVAFDSSLGGAHSVASLSETVGSLYPSNFGSADTSKALDRMITRGSTLYHELFHLTDDDDTLPHTKAHDKYDESYNLASIATAVGDQKRVNDRIKLAHIGTRKPIKTYFSL
ncbi:uncharacterized protein VDAG_07385 [Verticillium dahliae VdLs.17]|uniref:Uncharacterized protein n=1 Tax=Verticillium dahliae (strain VdLs.17 / ATCC MYA-4575 / FGSC 10137) TaxID=498257 RepID=G2XAQ4_VERDV|nr:uncharacterized protein VDAG_07385 [Verticillium dahliae VdLs.17]EGY16221.1 hypothetical protein VDAG_07385 [Verticillium dahliae VdLs.17]